jgi:hypothetical protein
VKRFLLLLLLGALPANAFTLISFNLTPATPLVYFQARSPAVGTMGVLSGYNAINTAAVQVVAQQRLYQRVMPVRVAFTVTTVGTGAGTYTVDAFDNTASAVMCVTGNIACNAAVGTTSIDCLAAGTATTLAGNDVRVRVNGGGCTTTPLGNASLEYQAMIADEGVDFVPRFLPYGQSGLDGGGTFFGFDSYQFDTITCGWSQPGAISGGTDVMRVQLLQKSDAGVVCTCDLPGTCADPAGSEHTCNCGGVKYLTALHPLGQGYAIQLSTATNCGQNPGNFTCAIPFRK